MKNLILKSLLSIVLVGSLANAEESTGIRLGFINGSGTATVDHSYYISSDDVDVTQKGFEGYVFVESKQPDKIGIRPMVGLKVINGDDEYKSTEYSTMLLKGNIEIYGEPSQFFKPFGGIGLGFGNTCVDTWYGETMSHATFEFSLSVGFTGDVNENFGYYAKFERSGVALSEEIDSYGDRVSYRMGSNNFGAGIQFKF